MSNPATGLISEDMGFSWVLLIGASFGLQWMGFVFAYGLGTERFYDALGTLGFVAALTYSFVSGQAWINPRACIATALAGVWTIRLGLFLVYRISKDGKDKRFDKIKTNPRRFFVAWTLQAVWVLLTALPVYTVAGRSWAFVEDIMGGYIGPEPLDWSDAPFLLLWALGFGIEVIADWQKARFRSVPANKDKFISSGLWAYSQHPNYLGEMMLWWSLAIFCIKGIPGAWGFVVAGPMFETLLLLFVSGIPILDNAAEAKWGKTKAFREYRNKTAVLIPSLY